MGDFGDANNTAAALQSPFFDPHLGPAKKWAAEVDACCYQFILFSLQPHEHTHKITAPFSAVRGTVVMVSSTSRCPLDTE